MPGLIIMASLLSATFHAAEVREYSTTNWIPETEDVLDGVKSNIGLSKDDRTGRMQ